MPYYAAMYFRVPRVPRLAIHSVHTPGCIALGLYGLSRQPAQTGVIQRLVGRFACEGSCMRRIQMRGARRWVMPSPRVRI